MDHPEKKCAHCSIPCEMKCSKCFKVWYCGAEHQKLHWKIHKKHCFPAIELKNDIYGIHLVSTRKILAGEIIFAEEPLIMSPFPTNLEGLAACLGCSKVLPRVFGDRQHICQKCSWPLCKPDCEEILWHSENECKIFQRANFRSTDYPQLVQSLPYVYECIKIIRILLLKESDPDKFQKFLHFESHVQLRKLSADYVQRTNFALAFIHNNCKMSRTLYSTDLIDTLLGVVMVNTIAYSDDPGNTSESYIYEMGTKLNHRCIPNTKNAMKSNTTIRQVFAATEIEKDEILTECYAFGKNFWEGIVERRQNFDKLYHFWCSCPRCSDPTELGTNFSAIKCKRKDCSGFYLPSNPLSTDDDPIWECSCLEKCKNTEKYSELSKTVAAIQDEIKKSVTVETKLSIIQKHANVSVHENHFTLMKLRYDLLPDLLNKFHYLRPPNPDYANICTKSIEFAKNCLDVADKFAPGLSTYRGLLLFYLTQALLNSIAVRDLNPTAELQALEEIRTILEEGKRILNVLPEGSEGHGMYRSLLRWESDLEESIERSKLRRQIFFISFPSNH